MRLSGKNAIVTGGGRSIGRAIALRLAKEGASLLVTYLHNKHGADETVAMIMKEGGKASAMQADFSSAKGIERFAHMALDHLGRVDILVNNAGVANKAGFSQSPEEFMATYQLNTFAPFILSQHMSTHMMEEGIKGCIIHISSVAVDFNIPAHVAYASSKAAINSITECSAMALAKHQIRVNAVAPGVIADGMNAERLESNPALHDYYSSTIPLGRLGQPADVANMVAFLASDEASWITGKIMDVDGGHGTLGAHVVDEQKRP